MTQLPDPRTLSAQQRRALNLICSPLRLMRARNGYGAVPNKISLNVASSLKGLGLARMEKNTQLVPTGAGRQVQAVIEVRRDRRQSA
ncbi:hypothetical protein JYU29_05100 [Tianweitania sp. BSSL-BM11]|uniref:Uncharacterized protein n=1 Tax=Tianweitania aestuarii TaxID=2814886 RepID=A0ABS5RSV4_9HYPH|nr:hypothetical protein [Tianweitania aestuarii]MBS9720064.1 hypothetical protein [Tianweitania aestuarii]